MSGEKIKPRSNREPMQKNMYECTLCLNEKEVTMKESIR